MLEFLDKHWVTLLMLITGIVSAYQGLDVEATVLGVGCLLHIKLDEMSEED